MTRRLHLPGTYNLVLGHRKGAGDYYLNGELDDFRIWNVARTQQEIAADMTNRLTGVESNLVAYWSFDDGPAPGITITEVTKVAAGVDYSLALRTNGTLMAWGVNNRGQCQVPNGLGGVADIAAGRHHALALKADGSVMGWGWNPHGQTNVPGSAGYDVVGIAAGGAHNLALKNGGTVVAWGWNAYGQTNVPAGLDNVVAIASGGSHSLALKADATVVPWGWNAFGQTNVPPWLDNVVAIAAGENHSLALRNTGQVVAWGWNAYGQTNVPVEAQSGVVAIAALKHHSLALRADGTAVAWGENTYGQTNLPAGLSNVVTIAAGGRHNVFLTASGQAAGNGSGAVTFVLPDIPGALVDRLRAVNADLVAELDMAGTLRTKAVELSGAKALMQAVLELGMSHTMERDDVLHGFFYGTEALTDLEVAQGLFSAETNKLATTPDVRPMVLEEVVGARYTCFATRLNDRLLDLQATGQPEIPRIVGHTLRLLNLLRDAYTPTPSPAMEMSREPSQLRLWLYGEPYVRYTLQESFNLTEWFDTSITNLHSADSPIGPVFVIDPAPVDPEHYYRAMEPTP